VKETGSLTSKQRRKRLDTPVKELDEAAIDIVMAQPDYYKAAKALNDSGYRMPKGYGGREGFRLINDHDVSMFMRKFGYRKYGPRTRRKAGRAFVSTPQSYQTQARVVNTLTTQPQEQIIADVQEVITSNLSPRMQAMMLKELIKTNGHNQ
jgi:hypothetical protein